MRKILLVVTVAALVGYANWHEAKAPRPAPAVSPGVPGGAPTSRDGLAQTIRVMRERVGNNPSDASGAVALAEALLRQARVTHNGGLAVEAEQALLLVLKEEPREYSARRMLGAVYLSQHRFADAVRAAERAAAMRPNDAWNYGVIGDGCIELGDYDKAFDAFDRMMALRPGAAAYARVSYAHELQGRLDKALQLMQAAADATTPHDPESQAWHYAHLGQLHFQMGHLADAQREYQRALFTFPDHPYARAGLARVKSAAGEYQAAMALDEALLKDAPSPETAAHLGDLHARAGEHAAAERSYLMAEAMEREGTSYEGSLARFLVDRGRNVAEALRLAESAAAERRDIFTDDTLAWAYFQNGRTREAKAAAARALRTGSRDRRVLYHAAAIQAASGDRAAAARLIRQAVDRHPNFDVLIAPAAARLLAQLDGPPGGAISTVRQKPDATTEMVASR